MNIKKIVVGPLQTNCYVLEQNNQSLIIDPGDEVKKIEQNLKYPLIGIVITHYHNDHIGALEELVQKYKVTVYDVNNLVEGINNIENFTFEMIKTPGHKEDLITVYFKNEKVMFSGDFLFKGTIGRTDLDGGNVLEMQKSIEKIKKYPKDTKVFPGHGDFTMLKDEIKNNPFFK